MGFVVYTRVSIDVKVLIIGFPKPSTLQRLGLWVEGCVVRQGQTAQGFGYGFIGFWGFRV